MVRQKTSKTNNREADATPVDYGLEQLVHLIATKFRGDTAAFFDSIATKPRRSENLIHEYGAVRDFLKKAR